VQPLDQAAELVNGFVRPRRRIDDFPFDVGGDLASLLVEAVSDDAGSSCETRLLQVFGNTVRPRYVLSKCAKTQSVQLESVERIVPCRAERSAQSLRWKGDLPGKYPCPRANGG
jgi:hypothetical protein